MLSEQVDFTYILHAAFVGDPDFVNVPTAGLIDRNYVATIGSNGFGSRGDNQTLLAGAPQQIFASVKVGF